MCLHCTLHVSMQNPTFIGPHANMDSHQTLDISHKHAKGIHSNRLCALIPLTFCFLETSADFYHYSIRQCV